MQDMAGAVGVREVRYGYDGANHLDAPSTSSNPYFQFDPAQVHRLLALCAGVRGNPGHLRADRRRPRLRVQDRRWHGRAVPDSECVSCGACVQACPTATLIEKSVVELGQPEHSIITTCAYCGVGCNFKAEMQGDTVVRMVPAKDGKANHGHSCVKGRFAWGYASHPDRILKPMMRDKITEPWREATWDEAIGRVAAEFRRIQAAHGIGAVGAITSSRCTNEETYPDAEAGARRFRQQQHRHLRAGLPFADRLRAEARRSAPRPGPTISIRSSRPTSSW